MFYNATKAPILSYASSVFYYMLSVNLKRRLDTPRRRCAKLVSNNELNNTLDLCHSKTLSMAKKIKEDPTHPLNEQFQMLPHGRRLRMPKIRTDRFKFSFVPTSIRLLNNRGSSDVQC